MRRKTIQINAPESLYNKIEYIRKKFQEKGMDIKFIEATCLLDKTIKIPKIPNLIKYEKQKSRRY